MALTLQAKPRVTVGPQLVGAIDVPGEPLHEEVVKPEAAAPEVKIEESGVVARKVQQADLPKLQEWLVPRLMERHPKASVEGILSQLRGATLGKHLLLVMTEGCAALAEAEMTPLEPGTPVVREKWLRCNRIPKIGAGGKRYTEMTPALRVEFPAVQRAVIAWAKQMGAVRVILGDDTDLPSEGAYEADSRLKRRNIHVIEFGGLSEEK